MERYMYLWMGAVSHVAVIYHLVDLNDNDNNKKKKKQVIGLPILFINEMGNFPLQIYDINTIKYNQVI